MHAPDLYQAVTDKIIAKLEQGRIPWKHFSFAPLSDPKNLVSGKPYRGINYLLLSNHPRFAAPWWLTYRQAAGRGGHVKKGEHGEPVVFWKFVETLDRETGGVKQIPLLRHYTVFNVEQCEGVEYPKGEVDPREAQPIAAAEAIEAGMPNPPRIVIDDIPKAHYSPAQDLVRMCSARYCVSDERYHETLLHELIHSTGHAKRLNRFAEEGTTHEFGSTTYAAEELVAEIGAAFLCARAGIFQAVEDNAAAYIASWLGKLRNDKALVVRAAGKAQKAAAWILNEEAATKQETEG